MGQNDDGNDDTNNEPEDDDEPETPEDGNPDEGGSPSSDGGSAPDPVKDALKAEQKKTARLQKKVEDLEAKLEDARSDDSEELQKLREKVDELEAEKEELEHETKAEKKRRGILEAAQRAGVTRPDAALKLVDESNIELDEDGVAGADAEMDRLKDEYSDLNLFGSPDDDGSDDDPDDGSPDTSSPDSGNTKSSDRDPGEDPDDEEVAAAIFNKGKKDRDVPL